jgi:hypothetical protein
MAHPVGSHYTDISRWTVSKKLKLLVEYSKYALFAEKYMTL